jgi:hypothetical protein
MISFNVTDAAIITLFIVIFFLYSYHCFLLFLY